MKSDSMMNTLNKLIDKKMKKGISTGAISYASSGRGTYNALSYGCVGDDSFDNTINLQKIIDIIAATTWSGNDGKVHGGGILYLPAGVYKITTVLTLCSNITIQGEGSHTSIIKQYTTDEDGVKSTDKHDINFYGIGFWGTNGEYSKDGTGSGIVLSRDSQPNITYCSFSDVWVYRFGQDGLDIETILVSTFDKVMCEENGRCGFWFHRKGETTPDIDPSSPLQAPCTSCVFNGCYANSNYEYGYYLSHCVYCSLNGCAADGTTALGQTKEGYTINFGQGIALNACAAESISEYNFKFIKKCYGCGLIEPWIYDLQDIGIHFESGCQQMQIIGGAQTDPNASANISVEIESGTRVTVVGFRVGDISEDIDPSSTTWIDSGNAGTTLFPESVYMLKTYTDYIANNEGSSIVFDSAIDFNDNVEFLHNVGAFWWRLFGADENDVPVKSIFLDATSGILKWKAANGVVTSLDPSSGTAKFG